MEGQVPRLTVAEVRSAEREEFNEGDVLLSNCFVLISTLSWWHFELSSLKAVELF